MYRLLSALLVVASFAAGEAGPSEAARRRETWERERIDLPLRQLAALQGEHGAWSDPLAGDDPSALAALAYLYAGYDHKTTNRHKLTLQTAISQHLKDDAPALGVRDRALRLMVLAEAYAMTVDATLRGPTEARLRALLALRLPGGGWPAQFGGGLDWPASAAAIMAMKTCLAGGIDVSLDDTAAWWLRATGDGDGDRFEDLAWKAASGVFLGETTHPRQRILVSHLMEILPAGPIPPRETWACAIACFQVGGETWKTWCERMMAAPSAEALPGVLATQLLADEVVYRWLMYHP
jgi:hypothetical protein